MKVILATAMSKFTAKSFFSITAVSMVLFLLLNIKIQTVLDEENGRSLSKLQIVFEFPSPFTDDSPIHDDDTDIISNQDNDNQGNNNINNNLNLNINTNHNHKPNNNDNNNNASGDMVPAPRTNFSYLFDTVPHNCVMEQDCHLYLSDSPHFTGKTMVVLGMVRDSEKDIIATLQQLDEISCIFDKIVFIFYESNSKDNTPFILQDWRMMYLDGKHCDAFRYNPNTNISKTALIDGHEPTLIKKILFHDFVDVRGKNRIVRFIIFRNMLLNKMKEVTTELGLSGFDYVMMIDLDIKEFDIKSLFSDLNDSPYSILCSNGLFKLEIMRDTFASIMTNGTWLYTYHSLYDHHFKDLLNWPYYRYEAMNSCFGGLAIYKDSEKLLGSQCKYIILEDIKSEWEYAQHYKNTTGKERAWPMDRDWFLTDKYREPLLELVTMFYTANLKVGKERRKICEHLAYHYCLRAHGYTLAISRDTIVYYFDFARMASNPL